MIGKEAGPYRILEKVGQGGMGVVYRALHVKLEQEVAIKVLAPEFSQDAAMRERFIQEARIQAKVSHPNVVNILNYVEDEENLFLVMEFLRGETLEHRLLRAGRLDDPIGACMGILSALEFMHARGIVHRDIKPGNIMFLEDGSLKVMDFGIAKIAGEKGQTRTGMRLGTLWYMSPEQIQGEEASVVSDLYAVGITLYEMATGKVPFTGESEYKIMKAHLEDEPVPPCEINSELSQDLGGVIVKSIAKLKSRRYQSAHEFMVVLQATLLPAPSGQEKSCLQSPHPKLHHFARFNLKRNHIIALMICLGTVFLVIGLLMSFRHTKGSPPIPAVRNDEPPSASIHSAQLYPSSNLSEPATYRAEYQKSSDSQNGPPTKSGVKQQAASLHRHHDKPPVKAVSPVNTGGGNDSAIPKPGKVGDHKDKDQRKTDAGGEQNQHTGAWKIKSE